MVTNKSTEEGIAMKRTVLGLAPLVVLLFTASLVAQSKQLTTETFSWNAELIALDELARIATVKAPILTDRVGADFERLKTGERITLRWSGYQDYADSIAQAIRSTEVNKTDGRFTFPVEYVSFDAARRYVTFKVQVPESGLASLKSLKAGEWVTATSPQGPSSKTTPIVTIKPYVITAITPTAG
jgi:hypothetical protein